MRLTSCLGENLEQVSEDTRGTYESGREGHEGNRDRQ